MVSPTSLVCGTPTDHSIHIRNSFENPGGPQLWARLFRLGACFMVTDLTNGTLRVLVIGVSGSGKTTFATHLAERTGLRQIEMDLINWRAGWHDRYRNEFDAFRADVESAIAEPEWVCAGAYTKVRSLIYARATTLVWLDLPFQLVLRQVVERSFSRALLKTDMLNGNRETFSRWLRPDHPIQIVWYHYHRKRAQFEAELNSQATAHVDVIRCRSRREIALTLERLTDRHAAIQIGFSNRSC